MVLDKIRDLDIAIGSATFWLCKAEDRQDLDSFNYWFSVRERFYRERAELLNLQLGGV